MPFASVLANALVRVIPRSHAIDRSFVVTRSARVDTATAPSRGGGASTRAAAGASGGQMLATFRRSTSGLGRVRANRTRLSGTCGESAREFVRASAVATPGGGATLDDEVGFVGGFAGFLPWTDFDDDRRLSTPMMPYTALSSLLEHYRLAFGRSSGQPMRQT